MPRSRAKVSASSRDISHIRVGTITRMGGIERGHEGVEAQTIVARGSRSVGNSRGVFHSRDIDELAGDERPRERGRRRSIGEERAALKSRQRVIAHELLAHVDNACERTAPAPAHAAGSRRARCRARDRASR